MATSATKSSSSSKNPRLQSHSQTSTTSGKPNSALSSHLAMVELKQRIIASLSKLSDRDTHQIAIEDLEKIIRSLPAEGFPMLLNSLLHDPPNAVDPSTRQTAPTIAKRECLRLLALLCSTHPDPAASHLPKIISHIVRRIKDSSSDSAVRDACRDAVGSLSSLYLGTINDPAAETYASVVSLFVKPFIDAMGEQNKGVQAGAALCLAKLVESAGGAQQTEQHVSAVGAAFQKLLPRICKLLAGQSFLAKSALLSVVSSLSQVGAITPQTMQPLLQSIRDCLDSGDWSTRKAAADTLSILASHSSHLVGDGAASTLNALEACRFDKVKPVRDSMTEALSQWKCIVEKEADPASEKSKSPSSVDPAEKLETKFSSTNERALRSSAKSSSSGSSPTNGPTLEGRGGNLADKAVVMLKKKIPSLNDKELNQDFFQKLETRISDDLPVEVVVPRKCLQGPQLLNEDETELKDPCPQGSSDETTPCQVSNSSYVPSNVNPDRKFGTASKVQESNDFSREKWSEQRLFKAKESKSRVSDIDERMDMSQKDTAAVRGGLSRLDPHSENRGSYLTIQRQLCQLERQQANLMNMLQDFMGGSHDSMITLENRVRGLERIVEEMARELTLSGRRSSNIMLGFEGSPGRSAAKFNGFSDYNGKFVRGSEGRIPYTERFLATDGISLRGRDPSWRDIESRDSYAYTTSRNASACSRRGLGSASGDGRLSRGAEHDSDQAGNRRGWDRGQGPFRLGEGPSARSVWQASKDEATLEAIRVAGEDNGTSRTVPRKPIAELDGEALSEDNTMQDRGPLWASWTHAMDSLHVGDVDSAYAEILSTGDDPLLVKLMDQSGPTLDQLSCEMANEVLHAVAQFMFEKSLHDLALSWIQQLIDLTLENGPEFLGIHIETKRELFAGLHEASAIDPPEGWEGSTAEQMLMQLAAAWEIDLHQISN